jgi:indole-3-glycerol phosphate synthase
VNTGTNSDILFRIVDVRRETVAHRKRVLPLPALKLAVEKKPFPVKDFAGALTRGEWNIIAELKKASPSRGVLRENYHPGSLGPAMAGAGAAALSILTEEDFFQGSLAHLKEVRKLVEIPLLRKDFIIDPWQVWEARAAGADSFLLIAAVLESEPLRELLSLGRELGMEPLVEVHTREELAKALDAGARIVGVNNRDLKTFQVRFETSLEIVESIPSECIAVSESGIRSHEDLVRLKEAGFDAFLIGEQLMSRPEPSLALQELICSCAPAAAVSQAKP